MKLPEHIAFSYLLAQLGPQQHYGAAGTALIVAAGLLPDLDGLTILGGWGCHRKYHRVLGHGRTADGVFYYAMELLDGVDLDRLVRVTGPLPPARVVHVLTQICGALTEAHDLGLIHRDIKPANVFLCRQGGISDVAKVLDFGLVRALGAASGLTHDGVGGDGNVGAKGGSRRRVAARTRCRACISHRRTRHQASRSGALRSQRKGGQTLRR